MGTKQNKKQRSNRISGTVKKEVVMLVETPC